MEAERVCLFALCSEPSAASSSLCFLGDVAVGEALDGLLALVGEADFLRGEMATADLGLFLTGDAGEAATFAEVGLADFLDGETTVGVVSIFTVGLFFEGDLDGDLGAALTALGDLEGDLADEGLFGDAFRFLVGEVVSMVTVLVGLLGLEVVIVVFFFFVVCGCGANEIVFFFFLIPRFLTVGVNTIDKVKIFLRL